MAETLTLLTPIVFQSTTGWDVDDVFLSKSAAAIKVTLINNKGERFVYRSIGGNVLVGLSFINQGKFMVNQGKSLEKWLLERIAAELSEFSGTVGGSQF